MGVGKWLKNKIAAMMIATSSVEKNALGQGGDDLSEQTKQYRRVSQGRLSDDLLRGELTQQVKELRWRMYKIVDEAQKRKTVVVGYDEEGFPITETKYLNEIELYEYNTGLLKKVKVDDVDEFPLELMVNNDEVTVDGLNTFENINLKELTEEELEKAISVDDDGNSIKTYGKIDGETLESNVKSERVISCIRELRSKFEIEKFTKKMNVRSISDTEKLLEFYVSKYPDEFNRKSRLFISEIKKAAKNPRMCDFLDISGVEFISYKTIGVKDLHEFEYKIKGFDKIVDFDGYYVIKFRAEVVKNGISLYDQYKEDELEEKYKNKESKNKK